MFLQFIIVALLSQDNVVGFDFVYASNSFVQALGLKSDAIFCIELLVPLIDLTNLFDTAIIPIKEPLSSLIGSRILWALSDNLDPAASLTLSVLLYREIIESKVGGSSCMRFLKVHLSDHWELVTISLRYKCLPRRRYARTSSRSRILHWTEISGIVCCQGLGAY